MEGAPAEKVEDAATEKYEDAAAEKVEDEDEAAETVTEEAAETVIEEAAETAAARPGPGPLVPYDNDSEEEASGGIAATASKIAAAKKATEEDAAAEDSVDQYIIRCISSDEEVEEDDDPTIFSIHKQMVEKETDIVINNMQTQWRRSGDGRLVKQSLRECVTERVEDQYYFSQCYTPSQKKKLRNIVRKRARDAMSDTSPTLPSSKFRK